MVSLDYLRTFKEFVECGTMAGAAKRLGLTQPAVSLQLRKLEQSSPRPLFVNEGGKKRLSPYGRTLYDSARDGLNAVQAQVNKVLSEQSRREASMVRLAGREEFLTPCLMHAEALKIAGELEFLPCHSEEAARKVLAHEADLALSYHVPQSSEIVAKKLFTSRPAFVYERRLLRELKHESEPFSAGILRRILLEVPLLVYRDDDPLLTEICDVLEIAPSRVRRGLITPNWRLIQFYASQGKGLAVMPSVFVTERLETAEVAKVLPHLKSVSRFEYHLLYGKTNAKRSILREWIGLISRLHDRRV